MNLFAVFAFVVGIAVTTGQTTPNCVHLLDVIAVVDGSDSIPIADFETVKDALVNLTKWLDISNAGQMFGAVVYSTTVTDVAPLSTDRALLQSQIEAFVLPQDGTNTHLGIAKMTDMMQTNGRVGVPKVGIVITDGRSKKQTLTAQEAANARSNGITMFAIGVGTLADISELRSIASSNDKVKNNVDFNQLSQSVLDLVQTVCKVHGNWTDWTDSVGSCSVSCGGGSRTITRTRTCTNPAPSNGGDDCVGLATEDVPEPCNTVTCPANSPCDGCRYINGVGYMPDNTDCAKFYQCQQTATSFTFYSKTCPAGLYWNQDILTCDWKSNVICTAGSVATPVPNVLSGPTSLCDGTTRGVSGDPSKYQKLVHGSWFDMPCAAGTVYSSTICSCIIGAAVLPAVCNAELYLPFNGTVQDYSGNNIAVQNNGVTASSGYGIFNNSAQLRILRFSNTYFGNTLVISFTFRQTAATSNAQALVTNADCADAGSIYITTSGSTVSFRVINNAGVTHNLSVSYSNAVTMNSVKLTVNGNVMAAEVNGVSSQTPFNGNIRSSQCALQVGRGDGFDYLNGRLDELRVFLCIP